MRKAHSFLPIAVFALALASSLFGASPAVAQEAETIESIRELILHADYEAAIEASTSFIQRRGLTAAQRNEALETLAIAHLASGGQEAAEPVLRELYRRDPTYVLQDADASPVIQGAFQRARQNADAPANVVIDHNPPTPQERVSPTLIAEIAVGQDVVDEVRVHYRQSGSPNFATVVASVTNGRIEARLPLLGAGSTEEVLEYYLVAHAPSDYALATLGTPDEPLQVTIPAAGTTQGEEGVPFGEIPEEEEASGGSKWWIALIVVAVAAGAGVGAYFLFRGEEPNGSLGSITLQ